MENYIDFMTFDEELMFPREIKYRNFNNNLKVSHQKINLERYRKSKQNLEFADDDVEPLIPTIISSSHKSYAESYN